MSGPNMLTIHNALEFREYLSARLSPPAPTLYEIRWKGGRVSGGFCSYESAAEYALEAGGFLPSEEFFVNDDGDVYSISADEDGLSKHIEGRICEVGT